MQAGETHGDSLHGLWREISWRATAQIRHAIAERCAIEGQTEEVIRGYGDIMLASLSIQQVMQPIPGTGEIDDLRGNRMIIGGPCFTRLIRKEQHLQQKGLTLR